MRSVALLPVLLLGIPCHADHGATIERLVVPLIEGKGLVGCVVGVIDGGRSEVHSYGEVHRGSGDLPSGETIYEIGSVTKGLTGTLLADMQLSGIVEFETPLADLLARGVTAPVAEDQPITLLHLATHTSGLPRLPSNMDPTHHNPYADYTVDKLYEFLAAHKLRRPPGQYEYSNYAMGLLGQVLAEKAGKSYEQLVIERICEPLQMDDTRITLTDEQRSRFAPAHDGELAATNHWDLAALAGAGGLRATCNDLLKLTAAALDEDDDRPVARAVRLSWQLRHGRAGEIGMGLGWHIARDGVTRWHNGQTGGSSSAVFAYPPHRLAVVVLSNTATDLSTVLAERIIQSLLGMQVEPIPIRKEVAVDDAVLQKYVGTYWLSLFFRITITLDDGRLMAQATGQDKFQIYAESPTKFFYKVVDAQITFVEGEDGQVEKLVLHQGGRDMPGRRTSRTER